MRISLTSIGSLIVIVLLSLTWVPFHNHFKKTLLAFSVKYIYRVYKTGPFIKKITRKWFKINSSNFSRIEEYFPCIFFFFFYKFQYIIMKRMKMTAMFITELVKCQFCIMFISINGYYSVNFIKMTKWKLFYVFCVTCKEEIDVHRYSFLKKKL